MPATKVGKRIAASQAIADEKELKGEAVTIATLKRGSGRNGHTAVEIPKRLKDEDLKVLPLAERIVTFRLVGTAPYMQARFSAKAMRKMADKHIAGSQAGSKRVREARNFDDDYEQATHFFEDGTCGIPAPAFRNALISACRIVGFAMTRAKLSLFVEHDGGDKVDGSPLVRIEGKREMSVMPARNATGVCDLRSRPIWKSWSCIVRIRFDTGQFSASDVFNLLVRVGRQVGIGEGRPDSRESNGLGFGLFDVELEND